MCHGEYWDRCPITLSSLTLLPFLENLDTSFCLCHILLMGLPLAHIHDMKFPQKGRLSIQTTAQLDAEKSADK